ncbi:MAG: GAF domain-containing protein [Flavobacteriales bacterium]|jgi:GAF domain-containing protein|nr:GAF domain-containing protein [Flavobacteriales bacterium]
MSSSLVLPTSTERATVYAALEPQLHALLNEGPDAIAAMANAAAALHTAFGWHWVGFYRVVGDHLVLGPFQGPVACTRIAHGKGVCGTAWASGQVQVVPDVDQFPGHIACSSLSRSEVVIPLHDQQGCIAAVLDVDSAVLNDFTPRDAEALQRLMRPLQQWL